MDSKLAVIANMAATIYAHRAPLDGTAELATACACEAMDLFDAVEEVYQRAPKEGAA